jgi:hypothetical protein
MADQSRGLMQQLNYVHQSKQRFQLAMCTSSIVKQRPLQTPTQI